MKQLKIVENITKRSEGLDIYLNQISRIPLITPEEEVELAGRIARGDVAARQAIVSANLRFVVSVAKQYQNQGQPLLDIIEDGNLGLIRAAEQFDATKGFKFISYAVWWIRQSIMQGISEHSRMVRLPLNQVGLLNKINKAISRFEQENGRYPSEEEMSEMIDFPAGKIRETLRVSGRHVSYDAPFEAEEDGTLLDVLPDGSEPSTDENLNAESLSEDLERAMMALSGRDREILRSFFGIGCNQMSLEEIGEKLNLTRERVRQIKERAIRTLNRPACIRLLRNYV